MTDPVIVFPTVAALLDQVGQDLGVSEWHPVEQAAITEFAELTGDRQWIHTDPPRARNGLFGGPIAHGMLTLSLLIPLLGEIFRVDGVDLVVNKGLDRVRFAGPVPAGARVRAEAHLTSALARPKGFTEVVLRTRIVVAGRPGPACTANCILLYHS
jgi:acyl dehydratase